MKYPELSRILMPYVASILYAYETYGTFVYTDPKPDEPAIDAVLHEFWESIRKASFPVYAPLPEKLFRELKIVYFDAKYADLKRAVERAIEDILDSFIEKAKEETT